MTWMIQKQKRRKSQLAVYYKKSVKEAKGALEEDIVPRVLGAMASDSPSIIMVRFVTSATASSSSDWPATFSSIDLPYIDE
jgi:hypothetical protein